MRVHGVQEFASIPENKHQIVKLIGFNEEGHSTVMETLEPQGDEQQNVPETVKLGP
jgi:ABC-type branched-subunit amino acid transport system ATPase component